MVLKMELGTSTGHFALFNSVEQVFKRNITPELAGDLAMLLDFCAENSNARDIFHHLQYSPKLLAKLEIENGYSRQLSDFEWLIEENLFDAAVRFYRRRSISKNHPGRKSKITLLLNEFETNYKFWKQYPSRIYNPLSDWLKFVKKKRFAPSTVYKALKIIKEKYPEYQQLKMKDECS